MFTLESIPKKISSLTLVLTLCLWKKKFWLENHSIENAIEN